MTQEVVLDKDGKPCRTCNSLKTFQAATLGIGSTVNVKENSKTQTENTFDKYADCPADVETLGRSTWTLLHTIGAQFPEKATSSEQVEMAAFLRILSRIYPCWHCAEDFRSWLSKEENTPDVSGKEGLSRWLCAAHNAVNKKLGKEEFNCDLWRQRWKDGWKDGHCDS